MVCDGLTKGSFLKIIAKIRRLIQGGIDCILIREERMAVGLGPYSLKGAKVSLAGSGDCGPCNPSHSAFYSKFV
jgi:hypothetical protein